MMPKEKELITVKVGDTKIQLSLSNTFEILDFFQEKLKVNPKTITLKVNGEIVSSGKELYTDDDIVLEILNSETPVNLKEELELEKVQLSSLMLKKFTDYRILKAKFENLQMDYERKLAETVMRENDRKEAGYIGNNINHHMNQFRNHTREEQMHERHEYEKMMFEADEDQKRKQGIEQLIGGLHRCPEVIQLNRIKGSIDDIQRMMHILKDVIENQ